MNSWAFQTMIYFFRAFCRRFSASWSLMLLRPDTHNASCVSASRKAVCIVSFEISVVFLENGFQELQPCHHSFGRHNKLCTDGMQFGYIDSSCHAMPMLFCGPSDILLVTLRVVLGNAKLFPRFRIECCGEENNVSEECLPVFLVLTYTQWWSRKLSSSPLSNPIFRIWGWMYPVLCTE